MRIERLNECAVIVRDLPARSWRVAEYLNSTEWSGLAEAIASYDTLGLYFQNAVMDLDSIEAQLESRMSGSDLQALTSRNHEIPICFELGEDLARVAHQLDLSPDQVIQLHLSKPYECYAVGFSPGFAYLGYLPELISGLPRLAAPRSRVEPGSVGITGRQTAVYPDATPGGWNLIARCPLKLVDVDDGYFPIQPGDQVQFTRIDDKEFGRLKGEKL